MQNVIESRLTVGRVHHPGYKVALCSNPKEDFRTTILPDRFRVILVRRGMGVLQWDSRRLAVMAPFVLCLNERESLLWTESQDVEAVSLSFHPSVINQKFDFKNLRIDLNKVSESERQDRYLLRAFLERDAHKGLPLNLGPVSVNRMEELMKSIDQGLKSQPDEMWPCRTRSIFLEQLLFLQRLFDDPLNREGAVLEEAVHTEIDRVLLYLHTHYADRVSVPELCRAFHTNRTTLSRRFRDTTGMTVMAYLTKLRLRLASSILRNTSVPVAEVMQRVGFCDGAHFNRTFKRYLGKTPSEYRAQSNGVLS